jgi:hypothetical protein
MNKIFLIPILLMTALLSCNRKADVNVLINSNFLKANSVIIDDTFDLKKFAVKDTFITIILKSGEHKLSINKSAKESFTVSRQGGILNLDHCAYVIFPIKYKTDDILANAAFMLGLPIILDSLVVYQKELAKNQSDLISLLKNPNIKDMITKNHMKIEKDQLFIDKDWDYGINEEMPDTITVSSDMHVNFKRKIGYTSTFLAYAFVSNEYNIEKIENKELADLINKLKDLNHD